MPLEQSEIEHLPEGADILVTWSCDGGIRNGPYEYVVRVDHLGNRFAGVGPHEPTTIYAMPMRKLSDEHDIERIRK